MQTVGEKLKRARVEKGISFEQAYRATKIHHHVLEALEQDRAHNFLSPLYIRGFLRTYARYLGLDSEKLIKEYVDSQKVEPAPVEVSLEPKPKPMLKIKPVQIFRVAAIAALLFVFVFYFRFVLRRVSSAKQKAAQEVVQQPLSKAPEEVRQPKVKVQVLPAPLVEDVEDLAVEIKTFDDCWLRVKVDDQAIFAKTLPKGRRERWEANEKIELRIGRPEALEVFLNGKLIDLKKAQVKRSLVITREGVVGH